MNLVLFLDEAFKQIRVFLVSQVCLTELCICKDDAVTVTVTVRYHRLWLGEVRCDSHIEDGVLW